VKPPTAPKRHLTGVTYLFQEGRSDERFQSFRRKDRKAWYCKVDGRFVRLHTDKKKARTKWQAICAEYDAVTVPIARVVLKTYSEWLQANRADTTWTHREPILKSFSNEYGNLKATAVKPP
jgi:hypothetical protein